MSPSQWVWMAQIGTKLPFERTFFTHRPLACLLANVDLYLTGNLFRCLSNSYVSHWTNWLTQSRIFINDKLARNVFIQCDKHKHTHVVSLRIYHITRDSLRASSLQINHFIFHLLIIVSLYRCIIVSLYQLGRYTSQADLIWLLFVAQLAVTLLVCFIIAIQNHSSYKLQ